MNYIKKIIRWKITILFLLLLTFISIIISASIGPVYIPYSTVFNILLHDAFNRIHAVIPFIENSIIPYWSSGFETIVMDIRYPRILLSILVGAALATSGATMQGLFKNPMADPFIIGTSAGAAFGATLTIWLGLAFFGIYTLPFMAFIGAIGAIFIVYNIAKIGGKIPIETLLLSGIAIGSFLSAITSFMIYMAGEELRMIVMWLMGGFAVVRWEEVHIMFIPTLIGISIIYFFARDLNIMLLGEEEALHLGIGVESFKKIMLVITAFITALAVSFSGLIGFVGLVIPHVVRIVVGSDHRILIPASALVGGIFMLWCDNIARTIMPPHELPVGIITALFGAPFFIYLLRKRKNSMF